MTDWDREDRATRMRLEQLIRETPGASYASVSALLGKNRAYIQQYLKRRQPRRLQDRDRRTLANFFAIPASELGLPGGTGFGFAESADTGLVFIRHISSQPDESNAPPPVPFRHGYLATLTPAVAEDLSIHSIEGDSMQPTLADGDEVLVDRSQSATLREGLYLLKAGESLLTRRLSVNLLTGRPSIRCDNPLYPGWSDCDPGQITIIGRIIWAGRRM